MNLQLWNNTWISLPIQAEGTHIPSKKGFVYKLCENEEIYSTVWKINQNILINQNIWV